MAQSDLADLKQRYDNLLKRLNSRPPPSDTKASAPADDPIVLRVALSKCRYGAERGEIHEGRGGRENEGRSGGEAGRGGGEEGRPADGKKADGVDGEIG